MITNAAFRKIALSFPEAVEQPHFDKASFRVNKKIFATLSESERRASLKLTENDQSVFTTFDKTVIYAVPNAWGKQGWTFVELRHLKKEMLVNLLTAAYSAVAPARLAKNVTI